MSIRTRESFVKKLRCSRRNQDLDDQLKIAQVTMSWSTLKNMQCNTSSQTIEDINQRKLGWEPLLFHDEIKFCPDELNPFPDRFTVVKLEKELDGGQLPGGQDIDDSGFCEELDGGQLPDIDGCGFCEGCNTSDLKGLGDNSNTGLSMGCMCSWLRSMSAPMKQEQEFDTNLPSLEQKKQIKVENFLEEEDYQQPVSNLHSQQAQQWQAVDQLGEKQPIRSCSFSSPTNSVFVPPMSSISGLVNANDVLQRHFNASTGLGDLQSDVPHLRQLQAESFPKNITNTVVVDSGNAALTNFNSSCVESLLGFSFGVEAKQSVMPGILQKEPIENLMALVSVAERHGLSAKRRKIEKLPEIKKTRPSWQLLLIALLSTYGDYNVPKGQRNLSDSLIGGNSNVRKTRLLRLQRNEHLFQGPRHSEVLQRTQVRLVMCERQKDAMVEAVVQFKDDQYGELADSMPYNTVFTMANAYSADLFANQFCALLEKDGFELVDDEIQPVMPSGNAPIMGASATSSTHINCSTFENSLKQLDSPTEDPKIPIMSTVDGVRLSDFMLSSPVGDRAPLQMAQPRVGSSSRTWQLNVTAAQPVNVQPQYQRQHQPGQIQHAQQIVNWTHLPQFNTSLGNLEEQIHSQTIMSQNQPQQQWEQTARPRRKSILPPAAWGA